MSDKSICGSCANNIENCADDIFKRLEEVGIYVQRVDNIKYGCMCRGRKSMKYDDEVLVRCSAYVRREYENHGNDND